MAKILVLLLLIAYHGQAQSSWITNNCKQLSFSSTSYRDTRDFCIELDMDNLVYTNANTYNNHSLGSLNNYIDPSNEFHTIGIGRKPIINKLLKAQLFSGSANILALGTLYALPEHITKWQGGIRSAHSNLRTAWTQSPVYDLDGWFFNYVGHAYSGALYYNTLRSQGVGRIPSFLFNAFQSTAWEYFFEAIVERPSKIDLIYTPVIGSVIGELTHFATVRMSKNGFNTFEKILVTIINPAYPVNNGWKKHPR